MPDFRFLALTARTDSGEVLRRIEPYDYDRALKLEKAGHTVLALNVADLPQLRPMTTSGPLTYKRARVLAARGGVRLDVMAPLVCAECMEELEDGEIAYGECVGCGWMVCQDCDAGIIPGTGQSVCPAPECRAHPDASGAEHTP